MKIYRNLPDIDTVIKTPEKSAVPTEAAVLYAMSTSLAHHATAKNFANVLAYAKRMPSEYLVVMVRSVANKREITSSKVFLDWVQQDGAKLFS